MPTNKPPLSGSQIMALMARGAARGINDSLDDLGGLAQNEAPIESGELRASKISPMDDDSHAATPEHLVGMVSFNKVYAAAQHEGHMHYMRNGKLVEWIVKNHPLGGKAKYLEDPFKAMLPDYEVRIGLEVRSEMSKVMPSA